MARAQVPPLFMADPEVVGALRMDVKSSDPDYVARVKEAFYADVSDEDFQAILETLHCDEPAQVAGTPSIITKENYGTASRHYIRCLQDLAIVIEGQDHMIELVDADMMASDGQNAQCTASPGKMPRTRLCGAQCQLLCSFVPTGQERAACVVYSS